MEELCHFSFCAEFPELDVALVVIGHPDFSPAIAVQIRESEAADCAFGIVEDSVFVFELRCITRGIEGVCGMITVSSPEDMRSLVLPVPLMRPHRVCEARSHVRHRQREGVFEIRSDRIPGPFIFHRVFREDVGPDPILRILRLMIVDEELALTIIVEIDERHVIGAQNVGVIDNFALDEATIDS